MSNASALRPLKINIISLPETSLPEGILLVDKPPGITSFDVIRKLRRVSLQKKIGHTGTLDPFATGLLIALLGRKFTRLSDRLLSSNKTYVAKILLGIETDSGDLTGEVVKRSDLIPSLDEVEKAISQFQGEMLQTPPMHSAKKVQGKKLYELARKGISIERKPALINIKTTLLSYEYPFITIRVEASKGTYIRTLATDLGNLLGAFGHLTELRRTAIECYSVEEAVSLNDLTQEQILSHLMKEPMHACLRGEDVSLKP